VNASLPHTVESTVALNNNNDYTNNYAHAYRLMFLVYFFSRFFIAAWLTKVMGSQTAAVMEVKVSGAEAHTPVDVGQFFLKKSRPWTPE